MALYPSLEDMKVDQMVKVSRVVASWITLSHEFLHENLGPKDFFFY